MTRLTELLDDVEAMASHPPVPRPPLTAIARRSRRRRARRAVAGAAGLALVVGAVFAALPDRPSDEPVTADAADAASGAPGAPQQVPAPEVSPQAAVEQVLALVEQHAYGVGRIDLEQWRQAGHQAAAAAETVGDVAPFVDDLLTATSPPGSPQGQGLLGADRVASEPMADPPEDEGSPTGSVVDGVGTILVPPLRPDASPSVQAAYVAAAWELLAQPACGWVVDLRGIYDDLTTAVGPVLSALAPLLGAGPVGGLRDRDGRDRTYVITDDAGVALDGEVVAPPVGPLPEVDVPVAVLQGAGTSTGFEMLLMAFLGRPDTVSYGEPTAGQPVETTSFPLDDGGRLLLTTAVGVDRAGAVHEGRIEPAVAASEDVAVETLGAAAACR